MIYFYRSVCAVIVTLCVLVINASIPAIAHDSTLGDLKIGHPWSRATPKGAPTGGGFLTITNTGAKADRLLGGTTVVAGRVEIHQMSMVDGVMRMRPLPNGIEIPPGATVELKPGSYHLMLMELTRSLREGDQVPVILNFQGAGSVGVEFDVQSIGAKEPTKPDTKNHPD